MTYPPPIVAGFLWFILGFGTFLFVFERNVEAGVVTTATGTYLCQSTEGTDQ